MSFFKPNPNLAKELERGPEYKNALALEAKRAAAQARLQAHDIMPSGRGQEIDVEVVGDDVLLVNYAHGGHLDEFGSKNNPPYAPLRRGARAAGLKLKES